MELSYRFSKIYQKWITLNKNKMEKLKDLDLVTEVICRMSSLDGYSNIGSVSHLLPEESRSIVISKKGFYPECVSSDVFYKLMERSILELFLEIEIDDKFSGTMKKISDMASKDGAYSEKSPRGFLLMGKVGCGKTVMSKIFNKTTSMFMKLSNKNKLFEHICPQMIQSYKIVGGFSKSGYDIFSFPGIGDVSKPESIMSEYLMIDDIGSENICSHYGNTTNSIGELILRRYDSVLITSATTNLDKEHLKLFYGERVFSRLNEMMNFIVMDGDDRRK